MESKNAEEIKGIVREQYGVIAESQGRSCCGNKKAGFSYREVQEEYSQLPGYQVEADLGVGCGLPTQLAQIHHGDWVLDLGCGAGNDVFIARHLVGDQGRVIGVDMTFQMIEKANANNKKFGYSNVEFILGEIESLPLPSTYVDIVISNCVLNLVPNKKQAFKEIFRVLKLGGHFCVSDIVLEQDLPLNARSEMALYAGCISGAIQRSLYLSYLQEAGFVGIQVPKKRKVTIPQEILLKYFNTQELEAWNQNNGVYSITVIGAKP
jgi:ubiquinone/menaquinone biosynthesis C-methylase UbiE